MEPNEMHPQYQTKTIRPKQSYVTQLLRSVSRVAEVMDESSRIRHVGFSQTHRIRRSVEFSFCGFFAIMARLRLDSRWVKMLALRTSCYGNPVTTSPKEVGSHA